MALCVEPHPLRRRAGRDLHASILPQPARRDGRGRRERARTAPRQVRSDHSYDVVVVESETDNIIHSYSLLKKAALREGRDELVHRVDAIDSVADVRGARHRGGRRRGAALSLLQLKLIIC